MADFLESEAPTLSFVPHYAGKTLVGEENTGNLYSGTFELTVNWSDTDGTSNISARIIDLKGVCGSTRDWFRHDSQDVGTIFLSGIDMDGSSTAEFSCADATAPQRSVRLQGRRC